MTRKGDRTQLRFVSSPIIDLNLRNSASTFFPPFILSEPWKMLSGNPHLGESSLDPQDRRTTGRMYHGQKAVTAYQPCRARKTKCGNVRPVCGFCTRMGADCTYAEGSRDYSSEVPFGTRTAFRNSESSLVAYRCAVSTRPAWPS